MLEPVISRVMMLLSSHAFGSSVFFMLFVFVGCFLTPHFTWYGPVTTWSIATSIFSSQTADCGGEISEFSYTSSLSSNSTSFGTCSTIEGISSATTLITTEFINSTWLPFVYVNSHSNVCYFGHPRPLVRIVKTKRWFSARISYYRNSDATFNLMALVVELSGDVHPLPGPTRTGSVIKITTRITNRPKNNRKSMIRTRNPNNCIMINTGFRRFSNSQSYNNNTQFPVHNGQCKRISIAHLNAHSLKNRTRFAEIKDMALEKKFDMLSFSETWFNTSVSNASVHLDGYKIFRLDRLHKKGGGVCAYVKSGLKTKILKDLTRISDSGLHQLWLQIQHQHLKSVVVCVVYKPPDSVISCLTDELMPSYTTALSLNKPIVLTGDLNCDLLMDNPKGDALRSFCTALNATQLIKDPTRVTASSSTLIDIVLTSDPGIIKDSGVLDITISDHFLVYAVLDLKTPKPKAHYITTRSYKNYTADQFCSDISRIPWNILDLKDSLDDKVDGFNDLFLACLNCHAPIISVKLKRKSVPYITDDIKKLISARSNLHKIARQSGSLNDWNAFKQQRCKVKVALKKAETDYYNHQIISNKNSSASLWKTIRRALPQKSNPDRQYTKDTSVLAEEFNRYFISVGEKASAASEKLVETYGLCTVPHTSISSLDLHDGLFEFKSVSSSDVRQVIMNIPNNKAPGYDKVPVSVIKDCLPHILPIITSIVNLSFQTSIFPHAWKKAEVVPHLKEGDHEVPDNNRPISLLPVLSKVAEKLALQQYTSFLSDKNRLTKHQSGNKKRYSTETLNLLVSDHLFNAIDNKKVTAMVLLDLSKAFDSICHTTLLHKLQMLGTSSTALLWFQS